jgi:shikimate dehydrogenase
MRVSAGVNAPIDASTRYCAVYGHPIRHSASPVMHNAGLSALQLNWRYLAFDVHPANLAAAVDGAKAMRYIGLNLTVPHKELAVDMVDLLDPRAREWRAVNTIVFECQDEAGNWVPLGQADENSTRPLRTHGYNTDADAIIQSLKEDFAWPNLAGCSVLLLGAGGAARSAALRLAEEKIGSLHLVNRTAGKASDLAEVVQGRHPGVQVSVGYPATGVDLVINATSLGLRADDPLPIVADWLQSNRPPRVYDMIYRPTETALLRTARAAGCRVANGLGMLLYQGAEALRLWTGQAPPIHVMRDALRKHLAG